MYRDIVYIVTYKSRSELMKIMNELIDGYEVLFKAPKTYAFSHFLDRLMNSELPDDVLDSTLVVAREEVYLGPSINEIDYEMLTDANYMVNIIYRYDGLIESLSYLGDKVVVNHCKTLCSCMRNMMEGENSNEEG